MFLSFSFTSHWMYSCKSHFGKLPSFKCIQGHLFLMRSYIIQIYSCCCCCLKSQQQTLMQLIIRRTLWVSRTKHKIKQKRAISAGSFKCQSEKPTERYQWVADVTKGWFPELSIISLYIYLFKKKKYQTGDGGGGGTLESSLVLFFMILPCHPNIIALG